MMSRPLLLTDHTPAAISPGWSLALLLTISALSSAAIAETTPPKPQPAVRPTARHIATPAPAAMTPKLPARAAEPVEPTGVQALAGRWSGPGLMTLTSGTAEPFKCVMTNAPSADGSEMKQNLRCRGAQNNFDAVTFLSIDGPNITGRWQDRIYSLDGTVRGTTTAQGLNLMLEGQFFQAELIVVSSGCTQTVRVVPRDTSSMKEIAADLRKC